MPMNQGLIENLDDFGGWDDTSSEVDFFSELERTEDTETVNIEADKIVDEINKSADDTFTNEENQENPDSTSKEEAEEDFFAKSEEDSDYGEEGDGESEAAISADNKVSTLNFLKEKGLLTLEEDVDINELDDLEVEDLLEDSFSNAVENRVTELFDNLPEPVKHLNKFIIEGGNFQDFITAISQQSGGHITEDMDLLEESNQELVVREMLSQEGKDQEEIDLQIKFHKENNSLQTLSEKHYERWNTNRIESQKAQLERQKENKRQEIQRLREERKNLTGLINSKSSFGDLQISKQDKKDIPSYILDRTVQLENGTAITQMQKELFYELPKNKEALAQLAILMKNRNEDGTFNFERIKRNLETEITKEMKQEVRRNRQTPQTRGSRGSSSKTLADFFK